MLENILGNIPGYIFKRVRKKNGAVEFAYISPYLCRIAGLADNKNPSAEEVWRLIHPDDLPKLLTAFEQSANKLAPISFDVRLVLQTGECWIRLYATPREGADGDVIWNGIGIDVTPEKETQMRLAYLAHHDQLTGLPNRTLLTETLAAAITQAREAGTELGVFHLRLVDFPEIQETLGESGSDVVIESVATRLRGAMGEEAGYFVSRVGEADFIMLAGAASSDHNCAAFANLLAQNVGRTLVVSDQLLTLECCIGVSVFDPREFSQLGPQAVAAELLQRAAIALSAAARTGAGSTRTYEFSIDHRSRHRMLLRHSLRRAIDQNELELHYQPIVEIRSGAIIGAEALIRWRHPQLGLLNPNQFVPLAEESGLILALGLWVVESAMRQAMAWRRQGLHVPRIAVNISGVQIATPGFAEDMQRILEKTGADATEFELEITESVLVDSASGEFAATFSKLRRLGFELVIDDFGSGYSSFQYVRDLPVSKIKIDQLFVRRLSPGTGDALIIRAIAKLAQSMGLGLVAEGIETIEQRDFLIGQGCSVAQGYLFSLPLAPDDLEWMLTNDIRLPLGRMIGEESSLPAQRRAS